MGTRVTVTKTLSASSLWVVVTLAVTACDAREEPSGATTLTEGTRVAIDGVGPIKVGMTRSEAERVSGVQIAVQSNADAACRYGFPKPGPTGLSFMLIGDTIARIDIGDDPDIVTAAGAHIGSTEADIERLYASHVTVRPRKYQAGHDLIVTDSEQEGLRYVFETDGNAVTAYRAGRLPEVEFVERCG